MLMPRLDLVPRPAVDSSDQSLIDGDYNQAIDVLTALRHKFERRHGEMDPDAWLSAIDDLDRALIYVRAMVCSCGRHVATSDAGCAACAERSAK